MVSSVTSGSNQRVSASGKFLRLGAEKFVVRGVTYGPFAPDAGGVTFPGGKRLAEDLEHIASLGLNVIRVYEVPSAELLERCAATGLRLVITVPWAQHVDFFEDAGVRMEAIESVRDAVRRCRRGGAVVLGYLVANEIESTLVRWMGPSRVTHFIEQLIDTARREDGEALFAYTNYPSTEYLRPRNADFAAFNVYLETPGAFRKYLGRLQNLSGDKPLLVSEFGLDVKWHGEARQAETMDWHWREVIGAGLSGSIWFSYTDEWHRGNEEVVDWQFGMVTRDRAQRAICKTARLWFGPGGRLEQSRNVAGVPRVSVIVCTCNGTRTLRDCLASLVNLRYPDYEIILVDDGSMAEVGEIAGEFKEKARYVRQEHAGLSVARNRGAQEATGEILAYTDDDCVVDEDWLTYLVKPLESDEFAAVGGPNIPPPPRSLVQACVAAAPGGPSHVLLTDTEAEHVPGCNLAVRRSVMEAIGGFRPEFVAAGDDVDFCWRLQESGMRIGFCPAAMVWHYRRSRVVDYLRQQRGYGRAEALLMRRHPGRFGTVGGARWRGIVYPPGGGIPVFMEGAPRIYQGIFGYAPFQRIYGGAPSELGYLVSSAHWMGLALLLAVCGVFSGWLLAAGMGMVLISLWRAVRLGLRAEIAEPHDWPAGRVCLILLNWIQPLVRGWARYVGGLGYARMSRVFLDMPKVSLWSRRSRLRIGVKDVFWNEQGRTRGDLFEPLMAAFREAGWECAPGYGWERWDLEISRPLLLWSVRLGSVTEYHEGEKRLTRVRLFTDPTALSGLIHTILLAGAIAGGLIWGVEIFMAVLVCAVAFLASCIVWGFGMLAGLRKRVRKVAAETGVGE